MSRKQRTAFIITFIVLLPLTISLFIVKGADLSPLFIYFKTFLSVGFVICSIIMACIGKIPDKLALFSMFALISGMLADIFLAIANKVEGIGYIPGALLFLFQHIMVCIGILIYSRSNTKRKKLLISMSATAAGVCLLVFVLVGAVGVALGTLAIPAAVYAVILAWTFVIPLTGREKTDTRLLMLGIAGILFFIADLLLISGFIENSPRALSASNLIPYYYAQYLIAFSTGMKANRS